MTDTKVGHFVWYDLLTESPDAAVAFYTHVVGWTSQPFERGYTMFQGSQGPLAGTVQLPEALKKMGAPPHWTSNVEVADVDATVAKVRELGGRVYAEPQDYPTVGRLAVIADPQGATINVLKPNDPLKPHDSSKPGEFTWSELVTSAHEAAFRFYATLFGWKKQRDFDMGAMGKYLIYGVDDRDLGGMFTKSKDMPMPPAWLYYVQVADLDAALARAKSKDARLLNGPMDVPGGARIAQLLDPQGAAFALHELAKKA
jgi:predicted enzyme related to lactoylglutathione lyase